MLFLRVSRATASAVPNSLQEGKGEEAGEPMRKTNAR